MGIIRIDKPQKCTDCKLMVGMFDCIFQKQGLSFEEQYKNCPIEDDPEQIESVCDNICNNYCKHRNEGNEDGNCEQLENNSCPLEALN